VGDLAMVIWGFQNNPGSQKLTVLAGAKMVSFDPTCSHKKLD
jgi:hypothetical protein